MRAVPWAYAMLRGSKVLAQVAEDGAFVTDGTGRVEIRYRPGDQRAYRAAARNLSRIDGEALLPDDTCAPAAPASSGKVRAATEGAARRTKAADKAPTPIPEGAWIAYTDGACSGNPGPAGLGLVLIEPGAAAAIEGYEYLGQGTNNIAELTAVLRALELLPRGVTAVIHTDSQYTIGIVTKGWKPKANQELVARLRAALEPRKRQVKLAYVPGHAGVPLNERADELAREAVRTRASRLPRPPKTAS